MFLQLGLGVDSLQPPCQMRGVKPSQILRNAYDRRETEFKKLPKFTGVTVKYRASSSISLGHI